MEQAVIRAVAALAMLVGVAGCGATLGGDTGGQAAARATTEATACLTGDHRIADDSGCLQDDGACYPLADGSWCTGPRGASCPMGSVAMPDGEDCPITARCIRVSPSLSCQIGG